MASYIEVIRNSFAYFPLVAFVFSIPYIIQNYHEYGSIISIRVLIVYSFILYLMTAYFLVILPLPSFEEVAAMTSQRLQLLPFNFVLDIIDEAQKTHVAIYRNKALLQVVFNVLMTVPFGVYLRYYFEFDFKKTLKYSFLLSLFFELTQLSALYFIYPRPYRLADVDDLMANTLGGVLGYYLAIIPIKILPSRKQIDTEAMKLGRTISPLRRMVAFGIDVLIIAVFDTLSSFLFSRVREYPLYFLAFSFVAYFLVLPVITDGFTIGSKYIKIRIVSSIRKRDMDNDLPNKELISRFQIFIRYGLVAFYLLEVPVLMVNFMNYLKDVVDIEYRFIIYIMVIGLYLSVIVVDFMMVMFSRRSISERISRTKTISIVRKVD